MLAKRAAAVVTALGFCFGALGGPAWGQSADPLGLIRRAALIPYFNQTPNNLFFILVGSPVGDNPSLHLDFYSATCSGDDSMPLPMSANDSAVVAITNTVTGIGEGAVLLSDATNEIVARGVWFDVVNNRVRLVDPAAAFVVNGQGTGVVPGELWSPYDTGAIIPFAPPDDGGTFTDFVIFSCPGGGLVGDMSAAVSPEVFGTSTETVSLHGVVFDTDEHAVGDWLRLCRCVGLNVPVGSGTWVTNVRLSQVSTVYAVMPTYTEIQGNGPFMGYLGVRFTSDALDTEFFGRLHHGPSTAF